MTEFRQQVDGERIRYVGQSGRFYLMVEGYIGATETERTIFLVSEDDAQSLRLGEKERVEDAYEVTTQDVKRSMLEISGRKVPSDFGIRLDTITTFFFESIGADEIKKSLRFTSA